MIIKYKNPLIKITSATICSLLFCFTAAGSTLYIKSDETTEVDLVIEPGDGTILPSKEAIKTILKPGEEKTIQVDRKTFDTETFSITGKVKLPSMNNKCSNLLIDKDYRIIFTGSKTGGTICKAEAL